MKKLIFSLCFVASLSFAQFTPKNFDHLLGKTPGLDADLLKMHFKLYQGYVTNTNKLNQIITNMDNEGKNRTPEFAGIKRMFSWEFDGMRLHEYYFENLGGQKPLEPSDPLMTLIEKEFGSFAKWKEDFVATGLIRGIGWVILYIEPRDGRLTNIWINEHNLGHLAGATPLLVMDVWEHAYITEYGLDRAGYIDAFFRNINWLEVSRRYKAGLN